MGEDGNGCVRYAGGRYDYTMEKTGKIPPPVGA